MIDKLELQWLRQDRLLKPPSQAIESKYYGRHGDPANYIKFSGEDKREMEEENLRTKQIEKLLEKELDNWIRWGRDRSFMPTSFKSQMGTLYRLANGDNERRPLRINDGEAARMERVVNALPSRHKAAFIMHHLDKAVIRGYVTWIGRRGLTERANIMGVGIRQLQRLVSEAHAMVLRGW